MEHYLPWLALTLAIELTILMCLAPRGGRITAACAGLGVNLLSHPLASLAFASGLTSWIGAELAVVMVEALGFRWALAKSWGTSVTWSLLINVTSATFGLAWGA